ERSDRSAAASEGQAVFSRGGIRQAASAAGRAQEIFRSVSAREHQAPAERETAGELPEDRADGFFGAAKLFKHPEARPAFRGSGYRSGPRVLRRDELHGRASRPRARRT